MHCWFLKWFVNADVNLSDMEDFLDFDMDKAEDLFHKTIPTKPAFSESSSNFNTTLAKECECNEEQNLRWLLLKFSWSAAPRPVHVPADTAAEMLEARVAQEQNEWDNFIRNSKGIPNAADYKPNAEQQAYLNQRPDLQNFILNMGTIINEGNRFIQEFEEMRELQEGLEDVCQFLVMNEQRVNIAECLRSCSFCYL